MAGTHKTLWKTAFLVSFLLVISFLLISPLVISYSDSLYQPVYEVEGFVYRSISNLSGRSQEPITGGAVSRGNNYRTGTAHLELTASERPTQTLYLRGFGGGEYIGGDWIRSSDEALFDQMQKALGWDRWGHMIPGMYYSMYFVLNENMQIEDAPDPIFLNIRHSSANYENSYVPYYSQRNGDQSWITQADQDRGVGGYTYEYYEQPDMHVNWENVRQDFSLQAGWYHQLQEAYIQQAQAAYTQVPEEILPRLTALVEETPLDKLFHTQIGVGNRLDGGRRRVKKYLWSFLRTAPAGQVRL